MKHLCRTLWVLLVACVAVPAPGCFTWGPYLVPEKLELVPLSAQPEGGVNKVIVSNFVGSATATSTTHSGDIMVIRESLGAWSLEGQIARELTAKGIPAEAFKDIHPAMLRPGEILVQGKARGLGSDGGWVPDHIQRLFCICTLLIYGGVLPFFYPVAAGESLDVGVEIVDSRGKILSSTKMPIYGYRRNLMIWTDASFAEGTQLAEVQRLTLEKIPSVIADSVIKALATVKDAPAGPAPTGTSSSPAAVPTWQHSTVLELRLIYSTQELLKVESGRYAASLRELAERTSADPFPAELVAADVSSGSSGTALRGYLYKVLTAGNGGQSYLDEKGQLTIGFAVLAWPATPGSGERWSFLLTYDGHIYCRDDWGDAAAATAAAAKDFSLQDTQWRIVE